jgi:hypothetical protein
MSYWNKMASTPASGHDNPAAFWRGKWIQSEVVLTAYSVEKLLLI